LGNEKGLCVGRFNKQVNKLHQTREDYESHWKAVDLRVSKIVNKKFLPITRFINGFVFHFRFSKEFFENSLNVNPKSLDQTSS